MASIKGEFARSSHHKLAENRLAKRELFLAEIKRSAFYVMESLYKEVFPYFSTIEQLDEDIISDAYDKAVLEAFDKKDRSRLLAKIRRLREEGFEDGARELESDRVWLAEKEWKLARNKEELVSWYGLVEANKQHPELTKIRKAILRWSRKWNLDADWCRDLGLDTVGRWATEEDTVDVGEWGHMPGVVRYYSDLNSEEEKGFLLFDGQPRYLPYKQKRREYLDDLHNRLQETIRKDPLWRACHEGSYKRRITSLIQGIREDIEKRYCVRVEDYYKRHDRDRFEDERNIDKYIKWTVQAQVGNTPLSTIAESENLFNGAVPNTSYVRREVLKVLKAIELPPRQQMLKPGRPKGAKDKKPRLRSSYR